MADEIFAGPVDYLVFGFPPQAPVEEGLRNLLEQVEIGAIEILDLEYIMVDAAGEVVVRDLVDLQGVTGLDLTVFDGATSGILDDDDLATIAASLDPGWFALAVVYEDRSLAAASAAWVQAGGRELLAGGVDIDDLAEALGETATLDEED